MKDAREGVGGIGGDAPSFVPTPRRTSEPIHRSFPPEVTQKHIENWLCGNMFSPRAIAIDGIRAVDAYISEKDSLQGSDFWSRDVRLNKVVFVFFGHPSKLEFGSRYVSRKLVLESSDNREDVQGRSGFVCSLNFVLAASCEAYAAKQLSIELLAQIHKSLQAINDVTNAPVTQDLVIFNTINTLFPQGINPETAVPLLRTLYFLYQHIDSGEIVVT